MSWEKKLLKLWEKRSDKQEEECGDPVLDFDELIKDVRRFFEMIKPKSHLRAWCPKCFDALDCLDKLDVKGNIIAHNYYCFGCEKNFNLIEEDLK